MTSERVLQGQLVESRAVAVTDGVPLPPAKPPKKYARARLQTTSEIASEIARVYRSVKAGELDSSEGSRRTYMLATLAKVRSEGLIESRLEALEEQAGIR